MKCNSEEKCMFLLESRKRLACSKKDGYLKNLDGCEHHRVYSRENYNKESKNSTLISQTYLSDNDRVVFFELAEQMYTAQEISDQLKVSINKIYYLSRVWGVKLKRAGRKSSKKKMVSSVQGVDTPGLEKGEPVYL